MQDTKYGFIFICAVTTVIFSGFAIAAQGGDTSGPALNQSGSEPARYRVQSLKHISAQQGKEYLARIGIDTVSPLPGANALLVTDNPLELVKASALLDLVDSEQAYVIKAIFSASEANELPANDEIAAELGGIFIGTFFNPPPRGAQAGAIIDVHRDDVIAVAEAQMLEKIVSAIDRLQAAQEADEITEADSDELFGELLKSLDEAEKTAAKLGIPTSEPNEPNAVTIEPEQKRLAKEDTSIQRRDIFSPAFHAGLPIEQPTVETAEPNEPAPRIEYRARSYEPEPIDIGEEMLELDLPEKLNIMDLLDLVGKYLNLDYLYDPAKVKGDIRLKLQGPIKVKDLYPLLESVLKFKNFVMTRKGNLVTIVPRAEVLEIDPVLLDGTEGEIQTGDVIVTRIFKLKFIAPASAKNLLAGMRLGVDINDSIADTGTLIVTGYAHRMQRIEEVLSMFDKPGRLRQFRFRQLKYTMAATLAPKIKTLTEQLGTVSIAIAAASPRPTAPVKGETAAQKRKRKAAARRAKPAQKPAESTVYLDADERTNRILMIGLQEQLDIVDKLIDTLDVAQQDLRTLRLYEIQHVGAEEVKQKLAELGIIGAAAGQPRRITARSAAKPGKAAKPPSAAATDALTEEPQVIIVESTNSLLVNATDSQHIRIATIIAYVDSETLTQAIPYIIYPLENQDPENVAGVLNTLIKETIKDKEGKIQKVIEREEDIVIVPDENTFSIIVYASKKNQGWIKNLIKNLDKRRPQVLIDVTLVEISKTDTFQYDLDIVTKLDGGKTMQSSLAALVTPFPAGNVGEMSSKAGTGKGFYSDQNIQALLTLMQQKKYGRVLAKPKILVNDNETGTISTENTTYVARSAEAVTDTGGTTVSTSYSFDEFLSGISLNITPHISEGNLLRLEIAMTRSTQGTAGGTNAPPPDKTENKIETIVTVPDNSTIILGGILTLDQNKNTGKVPLLGDIPLIGGLFRNVNNSDIQSKLYIFVKANILRPSETERGLPDLERISDRNRKVFEKHEHDLQEYEQWPGVKSEPMEPKHVLQEE